MKSIWTVVDPRQKKSHQKGILRCEVLRVTFIAEAFSHKFTHEASLKEASGVLNIGGHQRGHVYQTNRHLNAVLTTYIVWNYAELVLHLASILPCFSE